MGLRQIYLIKWRKCFDAKQVQSKDTRLRLLATQAGIHVNSPEGIYDASRKDRQKKVYVGM